MALEDPPLSVRIILDKESVDAVRRDISNAIDQEADATLRRLGEQGALILRGLEQARGHEFLAEQWTFTEVQEEGDVKFIEVFSKAEEMTFYARSGRDGARGRGYPIRGVGLLQILEAGAPAHEITPRSPNGILAFDVASGVSASRFGGTAMSEGALTERSFRGPAPNDVLFIRGVHHPGVVGNRFIASARLFLEEGISQSGDQAAANISARLR